MKSLLSELRAFITRHALYDGEGVMLIAVSGGVDSVVLADLWRSAGWPMVLAHCNFGLRGTDSDGDEAFVRELAAEWSAPVRVQRFDTLAFASANGLSVQMAARDLRYGWFRDLLYEEGYAGVATGHNLNDRLETALFHFVRGTGLKGLTGIPVRQDGVIRPLLDFKRAEIEAYARARGLRWREDSSNAEDHYSRNYLRLHVFPHLQEMNKSFLDSGARTLDILRDTQENYQFLLRSFLTTATEYGDGVLRYDLQALGRAPAPAALWFDILHPMGFTADQVVQLLEHLDRPGFSLESAAGHRLVVDRGAVLLTRETAREVRVQVEADDLMVRLPDGSRLILHPFDPAGGFPDGRSAIVADASRLLFPLIVRSWQPGDVFQPFGMEGKHQKLQDFLTNQKLSRLEKEAVLVLENGDGALIWVLGWRADERFRLAEGKVGVKIGWVV